MTVGEGTQMGLLVMFLLHFGHAAVFGSSGTVSIGGYVTGGGHGVFSGRCGLAADTVYELEAVPPSGEVVVANECRNQDLFWALRGVSVPMLYVFSCLRYGPETMVPIRNCLLINEGIPTPQGGGSTYGVITRVTMAEIPVP